MEIGSIIWIVIVDIFAWLFFHLAISFICLKLPAYHFETQGFYKLQSWEKQGQVWESLFKVRSWKKFIPDGTLIFKQGYAKNHLHGNSAMSLQMFLRESKRAEFTHWLSILPAPLFFLWNPIWAGWVMIWYALLFNLPIILVQRYNRGRIERILDHQQKRTPFPYTTV